MAVDASTTISTLDTAKPTTSDPKSEGPANFQHIKTVLKATFPNVAGAVTPTHTELNYVDGVTSAIQTQLNAKSPLASPTFTGVVSVPLGAVATPTYTFTGDANTGIWSPAADTIAFSSGGTEAARLAISGGNSDLTMGGGSITGPRITLSVSGASSSPFGAVNAVDGRTRMYLANTLNTASYGVHSGTADILSGAAAYSAFLGCSGNYDLSLGNNAVERLRIRSTGDVVVTGPGGLGYGTGSGGAVTQATSKLTGVTLSKTNGTITMHAASLAAASSIAFTLTNTLLAETDVVVTSIKSGATIGAYSVYVDGVSAGSCQITLRNHTAGALAEAVVISFAVIKAVAA